jgi:hypothetical protein
LAGIAASQLTSDLLPHLVAAQQGQLATIAAITADTHSRVLDVQRGVHTLLDAHLKDAELLMRTALHEKSQVARDRDLVAARDELFRAWNRARTIDMSITVAETLAAVYLLRGELDQVVTWTTRAHQLAEPRLYAHQDELNQTLASASDRRTFGRRRIDSVSLESKIAERLSAAQTLAGHVNRLARSAARRGVSLDQFEIELERPKRGTPYVAVYRTAVKVGGQPYSLHVHFTSTRGTKISADYKDGAIATRGLIKPRLRGLPSSAQWKRFWSYLTAQRVWSWKETAATQPYTEGYLMVGSQYQDDFYSRVFRDLVATWSVQIKEQGPKGRGVSASHADPLPDSRQQTLMRALQILIEPVRLGGEEIYTPREGRGVSPSEKLHARPDYESLFASLKAGRSDRTSRQ